MNAIDQKIEGNVMHKLLTAAIQIGLLQSNHFFQMYSWGDDWPDGGSWGDLSLIGADDPGSGIPVGIRSDSEPEDMTVSTPPPSDCGASSVERRTPIGRTVMEVVVGITNRRPAKLELQGMVQCLIGKQLLPTDFLVGAKRTKDSLEKKINSHPELLPYLLRNDVRQDLLYTWIGIRRSKGLNLV